MYLAPELKHATLAQPASTSPFTYFQGLTFVACDSIFKPLELLALQSGQRSRRPRFCCRSLGRSSSETEIPPNSSTSHMPSWFDFVVMQILPTTCLRFGLLGWFDACVSLSSLLATWLTTSCRLVVPWKPQILDHGLARIPEPTRDARCPRACPSSSSASTFVR